MLFSSCWKFLGRGQSLLVFVVLFYFIYLIFIFEGKVFVNLEENCEEHVNLWVSGWLGYIANYIDLWTHCPSSLATPGHGLTITQKCCAIS